MVRVAARIFLLLVLFCAPLAAEPETTFRIGIVSLGEQNQALSELVFTTASRYGSTLFPASSHVRLLELKRARAEQKLWEEEVHKAYELHDLDALNRLNREKMTVDDLSLGPSIPVSYTLVPYDEHLSLALAKSVQARDWLLSKENWDGLLLLRSESMDRFERIRIEFSPSNQQEPQLLLDRLVEGGRYQELAQPLGEAIFSLVSQDKQSVLALSDELLRFSLEVDGKEQVSRQGLLFLSPGTHSLVFRSASYEPIALTVDLKSGAVQEVGATLRPLTHPPLVVHSYDGVGTWVLEGNVVAQAASISLSVPSYPLMLTFEKEGFSRRIVQLERPVGTSLSISSLSQELDDSLLIKDTQKDFYKRLRNTILLFGAYVGSLSLSKTVGIDNPLWQVGMVGTSSVALVSAAALVMEMARYAAWAGTQY
ncbi:MAG: hypothetical protein EOM01_06630 [Spirochaetia bacterium]|nr:hypothetical protein [Spirochaetia bacterium]